MTEAEQLPGSFFEDLYRRDNDPWNFATDPYEQHRYDVTITQLPRAAYARAFEPACSIGALTERLAARCESLVATDAAPTAVAEARRRCQRFRHVDISCGAVPSVWPAGRFDLIVLSELGYYFTPPALERLRDKVIDSLEPGGDLLAVHWRGTSTDHKLSGDEVHRILGDSPALQPLPAQSHVEDAFRLEAWRK
ncbi:MAG: hypothetical protein QOJ19_3252 [Acidimicrobiia bacterium]|nr:hypothetical protein [Acidimicrobiia bacterium]